jgi:hypothetical protein
VFVPYVQRISETFNLVGYRYSIGIVLRPKHALGSFVIRKYLEGIRNMQHFECVALSENVAETILLRQTDNSADPIAQAPLKKFVEESEFS